MKALEEKALVGAFSVIVKSSGTFGQPSFETLMCTVPMSPSQASGGAEGENKYLFISRNSSDTKHCLVSAVSADRGLNMTLTQISSRIYNYILSHLNMKTRRRVMCATFLFDIDTCILPGVFSIWQQCTYLFTLHKPNGLSLTKYVAIFQL